MNYEIVPIQRLKPLEYVFPKHFANLERMIDEDGCILKPIIADIVTGAVLDGSHRYAYFLKHGYEEVPVLWVDYDSDNVRVGTRLCHRFFIDGDASISKEECRRRALSGDLFMPRTTRHFFTFRKSDISLSLKELRRSTDRDISHLMFECSVSDEIRHNMDYISEINEEIDIIVRYLEEISQTKQYLTKQIDQMSAGMEVAFFPGKFHPPHLGHMQTILSIIPKYKKIIIGVSEDSPKGGNMMSVDDIISAMYSFAQYFKNVEIFKISGVLSTKETLEGLPQFDVLLSGNEEVISWAMRMGIRAEYIPRSGSDAFSGTSIRSHL